MFKKITFIFIILLSAFSCSRDVIIEDVVERYEEGGQRVVHYYQEHKDGSRTWIRETWYYQEGMKHLDGPIVDGKRNGVFETYYKSGTLMSKGDFVEGKRDGKATVFYENGKVNYEGFYKNGKECGIWKFYDEDGNIYNEVNRDLQ